MATWRVVNQSEIALRPQNGLQSQLGGDLNIWQTCHKIREESSKIVPLGAPLSLGSSPGTWVTQRIGYIDGTFGIKGFSSGSRADGQGSSA